jgi:CubicO group peptidase (beta-lactamase class C family)
MRKLLMFAFFLPLYLFAQDQQLEKFVDSLVGPFSKPDMPGTMIMVVQDGKTLVKKAYGMANLELGVPLRTDHAFAIGSVSKQFTAIAILQLAQQGKLSLNDDIRKYIPFFDTHGSTITIENLLTHTSGISSANFGVLRKESGLDTHPDNFLHFIMKSPLDFEPGTDWSYSNNGFRIASIIVERVSGQTYAAYIKEHLFEPAGMHQSFVADDLQTMNNVASSYSRSLNGTWRNANRIPEWNWAKGAGSIISTLDDMSRWKTALLEGKILPCDWLERAWTSYKLKNGSYTNYGYGFNVTQHKDFRIIHHNGGIYGYRGVVVIVPEKKLYLEYVNLYSGDYTTVAKKILNKLLQLPAPTPDEKSAGNLADYAGDYEQHYVDGAVSTHSNISVFSTVQLKGDSIYFQERMGEPILLLPAGKDRFVRARSEDGFYEFNRDKNGKVISMRYKPFLYGVGNSSVENKRINAVHTKVPEPVNLSASTLKKYTGTYYRMENGSYFIVELQGNKLIVTTVAAGSQKFELIPVSENKFIRKGMEDYSLSFHSDGDGTMSISVSGFTKFDFKKIADSFD